MIPPDPNQRMDELLRGYAKKRREQASGELSAQVRARLHEEVRRTFRKSERRQRWTFPVGWWWKLPVAGLGLAALVVLSLRREPAMLGLTSASRQSVKRLDVPLNHSLRAPAANRQTYLAGEKNQALGERSELPTGQTTSQAASPAASGDFSLGSGRTGHSQQGLGGRPESTAESAPPPGAIPSPAAQQALMAAPAVVASAESPHYAFKDAAPAAQSRGVLAGTPAASAPPKVTNAVSPSVETLPARSEDLGIANSTAGHNQFDSAMEKAAASPAPASFLSGRRNKAVAPELSELVNNSVFSPSNILNSFRIERTGRNVQVVDQDGSIYKGHVLVTATLQRGKLSPPTGSPAVSNLFDFEVSGLNRRIQQEVTFTGEMWSEGMETAPAAWMSPNDRVSSNLAAANNTRNAIKTAVTNGWIVSGRAKIGAERQFQVHAVGNQP